MGTKMDKLLWILDMEPDLTKLRQTEIRQEVGTDSGFVSNVITGYRRGHARGVIDGQYGTSLDSAIVNLANALAGAGVETHKIESLKRIIRLAVDMKNE